MIYLLEHQLGVTPVNKPVSSPLIGAEAELLESLQQHTQCFQFATEV